MKVCADCKVEKPFSEFSKNRSRRDGLQAYCRECHKPRQAATYMRHRESRIERSRAWTEANKDRYDAYKRAYYQENRDRIRAASNRNRLLREYGITPEQRDEMYTAQGGVCAICKTEEAVAIDHCHSSGAVRALLCNACNWLLGQAGDDPAVLRGAADYLEAHRA